MQRVDDSLTLLGISWADDAPTLALRRGPHDPSVEPLIGQELAIEVDPTARRWCLGASGTSHTTEPCDVPPEEGRKTCTSCSVKNARFAGALHHAHQQETSDPDLVKHLDQPNRLYLAAFRDGSIKVGTSTERRATTRLLEQGAWLARFVATTTNGIVVRVVEDRVTDQLALPQSVAISRKIDGLTSPRDDAWLASRLDEYAADVRRLIGDEAPAAHVTATDDAWTNPAAADPLWQRVHSYPAALLTGRHAMQVVGAVGRAVAFRRKLGGDVFVADLQPLLGLGLRQISGEVEPDEVTVQDRLF